MAQIYRTPIYGRVPSCAFKSRIEERLSRARQLRLERTRKCDQKPEDFVCYEDSDEEENACTDHEFLNISNNFVDYVRSRELDLRETRSVRSYYGCRHILTHDMLKEYPVSLGHINKVFCSQWLSDRQVVFGTKCNKLMVYDVVTQRLDRIPSLRGRPCAAGIEHSIHTVEINPSRTLLGTCAVNSSDVAVYRLPTLDPVCVGMPMDQPNSGNVQTGHRDSVYDLCWLDDQFLISGSRDNSICLWRIQEDEPIDVQDVPTYRRISAVSGKTCKSGLKVRALAFNKGHGEFAALTLNGYIHIWSAETFRQKLSRKLPSSQDNVCIAAQDGGLYAVGCKSHTLLLDPRTLQSTKRIASRFSGLGIRSASFQGNLLTIGTGAGTLMFYDLRAGKYLESSINSSRTVMLKISRGYLFPDEEYVEGINNGKYSPSVYTHCFDPSGTRLFAAGGPLNTNCFGNYAGLWSGHCYDEDLLFNVIIQRFLVNLNGTDGFDQHPRCPGQYDTVVWLAYPQAEKRFCLPRVANKEYQNAQCRK